MQSSRPSKKSRKNPNTSGTITSPEIAAGAKIGGEGTRPGTSAPTSSASSPPDIDSEEGGEDLGRAASSYAELSRERFTGFAWWQLQIAQRVKTEGDRAETVSTRRLATAMLATAVQFQDRNSTAYWLLEKSSYDRDQILARIRRLYPQVGSRGFFDQQDESSSRSITSTLSAVLSAASQLASSAHPSRITGARHIVAAMLSMAARDPEANIARFLRGCGIEPADTLNALLTDIGTWDTKDNVKVWHEMLGDWARQGISELPPEPFGGRPKSHLITPGQQSTAEVFIPDQGYARLDPDSLFTRDRGYARLDPDSPEGDDKLDITNDVNALAKMIAAWKLEPPLAVGLFGEWGSGKTFFMNKLRKAVAGFSKSARERKHTRQNEEAYCKYIAQVEFNAWHYSEGDLWAGMVHHIFTNLQFVEKEPESELVERTKKAMEALKAAQGTAAQQLELLKQSEKAVIDKQAAKVKAEQEAADATRKLSVTANDVVSMLKENPELKAQAKELLAKIGLDSAAIITAEQVQTALVNARKDGATAWRLVSQLGRDLKERPLRTLFVYGALVGLPFVVGYLVKNWSPDNDWIKPILSLAPSIMAGAGYISLASQRLSQFLDEPRRKIEEEQQKKVAQLQQELDQTITARNAARKAADEASIQVEKAKLEVQLLTPESLLSGFLTDRAGSKDYREKLGLLAMVRCDFDRLSRLMMDQRESDLKATTLPTDNGTLRLNRIILYIDDLDRCPPDRVVKVLQAVHLLLAFRLFVVVVGVDARWVQRSLRHQYKLLLQTDENGDGQRDDQVDEDETIATPRDYLEKIFQIPLWLQSMSNKGQKDLVNSLVALDAKTEETLPEPVPKPVPAPLNQIDNPTPVNPQPGPSVNPAPNPTAPAPIAPGPQQTIANPLPDAPPEKAEKMDHLKLEPKEIEMMERLASLYGRSPRAIKRYVNCYRLFRSMIKEQGSIDYTKALPTGGYPYELPLLLMAIVIGAPTTASRIVELASDTRNDKTKLRNLLDLGSADSKQLKSEEMISIQPFLDLIPPGILLHEARDMIFRTWRFSFRSSDSSETIDLNGMPTHDKARQRPA